MTKTKTTRKPEAPELNPYEYVDQQIDAFNQGTPFSEAALKIMSGFNWDSAEIKAQCHRRKCVIGTQRIFAGPNAEQLNAKIKEANAKTGANRAEISRLEAEITELVPIIKKAEQDIQRLSDAQKEIRHRNLWRAGTPTRLAD